MSNGAAAKLKVTGARVRGAAPLVAYRHHENRHVIIVSYDDHPGIYLFVALPLPPWLVIYDENASALYIYGKHGCVTIYFSGIDDASIFHRKFSKASRFPMFSIDISTFVRYVSSRQLRTFIFSRFLFFFFFLRITQYL